MQGCEKKNGGFVPPFLMRKQCDSCDWLKVGTPSGRTYAVCTRCKKRREFGVPGKGLSPDDPAYEILYGRG